jgi:hypothetical protein
MTFDDRLVRAGVIGQDGSYRLAKGSEQTP